MSEKKKRKWLTPYTITIIISCIMAARFEYQQELKEENKVEINIGDLRLQKELIESAEKLAELTDKYSLLYDVNSEYWEPNFTDINGEIILEYVWKIKTTDTKNLIILYGGKGKETCKMLYNWEIGEEIGRYSDIQEVEVRIQEGDISKVGFLYREMFKPDWKLYVEGVVYEEPIIKDDSLLGVLIFEIVDGNAIQRFDMNDTRGEVFLAMEELPNITDKYSLIIKEGEWRPELVDKSGEIIVKDIYSFEYTGDPQLFIIQGNWGDSSESHRSAFNLLTGERILGEYTSILEVAVRENGVSKVGFIGRGKEFTGIWDLYVDGKLFPEIVLELPSSSALPIIEINGNKVTQLLEEE